ncbi:Ketopantoate_reductase PanE/ApbA family protein [Hexamita inflata]|uniref:2-dehydropantoate 2-reductase n=1 Tax=Hexamita inflata TaxID=28002 RepID=A0AA86N6N5_9EUKA|nr:Ketopantoate reductase PanE/ApbA family protein [Hexamita inflata]
MQSQKIAIIGAGAMGTLFGTHLLEAGKDVIFYDAWEPLVKERQQNPVATLKYSDHSKEVKVQIKLLDKSHQDPVDIIIFFVKSSLTKSTIELASQANLIKESTILLTCQGGFENPEFISKYIKPANILVGCTTSYCKAFGMMQISNFDIQATTVWPYKGEPTAHTQAAVQLMSSLKLDMTPKAVADIWKMQLYYTSNIAVSAITKKSFGDAFKLPEGELILYNLADECAKIAKLEGVDTSHFNSEVARKAVKDLAVDCAEHFGSMCADLNAKRVTEIDGTAGALLRKAKQYKVELPFTEAVWALVRVMEQ